MARALARDLADPRRRRGAGVFVCWESRRIKRGEGALVEPAMLRNLQLRSGVMSFLFMFLIQAGMFFVVAAVPVGRARALGDRDRRPAAAAVALAARVRHRRPEAAPRREPAAGRPRSASCCCSRASCCWSRCSTSASGPEIVTWPLLLAGAGLGAMASQLGAVTVSAVPDEQSGEVGGLQNTGTQLGASIGTALAGAVLISAMTAAFFTGIQNNPNVPSSVVSKANTELASGVPFMSEADVKAALSKANVPSATANEIIKVNKQSQIDGLRAAEAILALLALIALPFTRGIPTVQPGAQAKPTAATG